MAGGRRTPAGRSTSNARLVGSNQNITCSSNTYEERKSFPDYIGRALAPKHVPIPFIAVDGHLLFESVSLGVVVMVTFMQFLNLYKTVWWLPQSFQEYKIHFYLIDPYLILFIGTFSTRQIAYALLCKFMDPITPLKWVPVLRKVMRVLLLVIILGVLGWCAYYIGEKHNSFKILYLCYPVFMYFMIFGTDIEPFFDASTAPVYIKEDKKTKYILDKPMHNCSVNAVAIRAEVANLREDFNHRIRRALFTSFGSAYLCGIAPLLFVPQQLHFDLSWVMQYTVLIWLGRVGAYFAQAYPVRYCDVLHRAALHLGKWTRVEVKMSSLPIQTWSDTVLWPHGSVIKHNKDFYRSDSFCTAAEPGDSHHARFYALFGNPTVMQRTMLAMHLTLVAVQLVILYRTTEWYKIISLSLLVVTNNYYTLFRLTRDYLVSWRVYKAEQIVQEKAQLALLAENHRMAF